jgi:GST-like protein
MMIDFYTWSTPNGHKVAIMLEETGLDYTLRPVNLGAGDQKQPAYMAVNPNGKIPAIVDHDGPDGRKLTIFESGAVLLYLAEKSGRFLAADPDLRWRTVSWLMFQMGGLGPMLGQAGYFLHLAPEPVPAAVERFVDEAERIFGVVDGRLGQAEYLAGDYSIADMASYPWLRNHVRFGVDVADYPNLARWLEAIGSRPAVQRGLGLLES